MENNTTCTSKQPDANSECTESQLANGSLDGNQLSQSSRDIADSSSSELESLSAVVVLGLNFRYGFRGCWLTLRVVLQSLHHRSTAESGVKWLRGGPSVVISRRSSTVETWRDVLLSVLMTFRLEKKL